MQLQALCPDENMKFLKELYQTDWQELVNRVDSFGDLGQLSDQPLTPTVLYQVQPF